MAPFTMNSFDGKRILALVREGDYAHAGEEEAIELTMADVPKDSHRLVLDAGCGRGGTAAYLQSRGWGLVTGLDIEADSVAMAREAYPDVHFVTGDICAVATHVSRTFDVVTMFNVLYALPDPPRALAALATVAAANARLLIFDYVDCGHYQDDPILEAGRLFLPHPPKLPELADALAAAGWRIAAVRRIDQAYERWYAALLDKINAHRAAIEAIAGTEAYQYVHEVYGRLHATLRAGRLGGAIIESHRAA